MLAQRLRHRVTVQQLTVTLDEDTGAQSEAWTDFLTDEPADIVPMSGREFVASNALQAGVNTRMTIRHHAGLMARMRVVHEGVYYDIKAILPDPKFRQYATLMCEAGVNEG